MDIKLIKTIKKDAHLLLDIQKQCFENLLIKYKDYDVNPAYETLDRIEWKIEQLDSNFYFIRLNNKNIGGIRVIYNSTTDEKRISPLFVLPEYQNKGIAQTVIKMVEQIYGEFNWSLSTILQEEGNCYLYEKMGYHKTGETKVVNDKMTLVFYIK